MAREKNLRIKAEDLNKKIKSIEGANFGSRKISEFILGKGINYYKDCLKTKTMCKASLERLCNYYNLNIDEYIVKDTPQPVKQEEVSNPISNDLNLLNENLVKTLGSIDRHLQELICHQRTTNIILKDILQKEERSNKNQNDILDILEPDRKKAVGGGNNVTSIARKY